MALPVFKTGEAESVGLAGSIPVRLRHQPGPRRAGGGVAPLGQAARWRTSQTVTAMSSAESASSQPPSIHWNGQNRLPG